MATTTSIQAPLPEAEITTITGKTGLLARIFSRHFLHIAVLLVLPLVMAQPLHRHLELLRDPDIWWHMANARALFSTHHFVRVEPYSFTVAGQRWINPEWLAEVPYWLGFRALQFTGVYLVTWLLLAANVVFLYWRGYLKGHHSGAAFWAALLGMVLMAVNGGPRTIIVAYLALSAELAILEAMERGNARLAWLLPPIFCVWINLHGSWMIGLALFVLYIACGSLGTISTGVFEQAARTRKEYGRLFAVFFASLAALIINPYGWRLIWNPIDMMLHQKLNIAYVEEWQPLHLSSGVGKAAFAAIALMVLASCLRSRKWKVYELAFVFFAWYAAFDHVRFTSLAAVIMIPLLAQDMARSFCARKDSNPLPVPVTVLALACSVVLAASAIPSNATLRRDVAELFPLHTIRSLDPHWRTFNVLNLGGVMAFEHTPTFIDSRMDTFEHHGVFKDYLDIVQIKQPLEILAGDRLDHVLFPDDTPLVYLLERTPGWHIVSREGQGSHRYVLLARTEEGR
jgi:hypothetical protein